MVVVSVPSEPDTFPPSLTTFAVITESLANRWTVCEYISTYVVCGLLLCYLCCVLRAPSQTTATRNTQYNTYEMMTASIRINWNRRRVWRCNKSNTAYPVEWCTCAQNMHRVLYTVQIYKCELIRNRRIRETGDSYIHFRTRVHTQSNPINASSSSTREVKYALPSE